MSPDDAVLAALEIPGWMTKAELYWLAEQAADRRVIIEVGSWQGRSTKALASMTKGLVISIDSLAGESGTPVDDLDGLFRDHLKAEIESGKVEVVRKPSLDAAQDYFDGFADMVFIDGCHEYPAPLEDIRAWRKVVRRDGLVCGHDRWLPGVERSLDEYSASEGGNSVQRAVDSIWTLA